MSDTQQPRTLFNLYLSKEEREMLKRLAEAHGYATSAPYMRRLIREAQKAEQQQTQKEQAYA